MAQEEDILLGITEEHNRNLDKLGPAVKGKKIAWSFSSCVSPPLFSIHKTAHEFFKLGLKDLSGEEMQICRVHELWE